MANSHLAPVEPGSYRWAVHCCSYKIGLDYTPDHALALFADEAMAKRYGAWMWPSTFEVVDLLASKEDAR